MPQLIQFPRGSAQYTSDELIPAVTNYYRLRKLYKETEKQSEEEVKLEWKKISRLKKFKYWWTNFPYTLFGCFPDEWHTLRWKIFNNKIAQVVDTAVQYSVLEWYYYDTYLELNSFSKSGKLCHLTPKQVDFILTFTDIKWKE